MTTYFVALLGAGIGLGIAVVLRAILRPREVPLNEFDRLLAGEGIPASRAHEDVAPRTDWFEEHGSRLLSLGGRSARDFDSKLALTGKSRADFAREKLLLALTGFGFPLVIGAILVAAGIGVSPALLVIGSIVLCAAGFFYPDLALTEQAEEQRRAFRFGLSAYLDFVAILVAGGAGTQSALNSAAEAGGGWCFESLRDALRLSATTGRSPWEVFDEMAEELTLSELHDLASSVSLAGGHGARVKESLIAKADAMRSSQAAELEAMAETQTEKMILPVIVMVLGLFLFVGYGAFAAVTSTI